MTIYDKLQEVYRNEPCARTFQEDLQAHLINGFVFSRPDFFIMGRPVRKDAPANLITDPWQRFPSSACDCWHIYLFSGNMARAWAIVPWELPWFSFERRNDLRFYRSKDIERLSNL